MGWKKARFSIWAKLLQSIQEVMLSWRTWRRKWLRLPSALLSHFSRLFSAGSTGQWLEMENSHRPISAFHWWVTANLMGPELLESVSTLFSRLTCKAFWSLSGRNSNFVSLHVSQRNFIPGHAYIVVSKTTFLLINDIAPFCQKWEILDSKNSESVALSWCDTISILMCK